MGSRARTQPYRGRPETAARPRPALIDALLTLLIAIPLGFTHLAANWPALAVRILLSALVFLAIGFAAAALVLVSQQGGQLPGLLTAALTLISGAFFPLAVLPGWMQTLADLSPLTYALRALRRAALEGQGLSAIAHDLAIVGGFALVMLPASVWILSLAFDRARRTGSLARF